MSFIHTWQLVCTDCKSTINLGYNTIKNIIQEERILHPQYEDFKEFLAFTKELSLTPPEALPIAEFLAKHGEHYINIEIQEQDHDVPQQGSPCLIMFSCKQCEQISTSPTTTNLLEQVEDRTFTTSDLEKLYTCLETYNKLGCLFNNHSLNYAIEPQLPFLKTHCNHGMVYSILPK